MDSFFGIGAPELVLILIIAGLVMGPERIGRTARWLGRTTAQLQNISRSFIRQLNAELDLDGEQNELKNTLSDMQDLRRQLDELKGELTAVTGGALRDADKKLARARNEMRQTIAPPHMVTTKDGTGKLGDDEAPDTRSDLAPPDPLNLPQRIEVADDPDE